MGPRVTVIGSTILLLLLLLLTSWRGEEHRETAGSLPNLSCSCHITIITGTPSQALQFIRKRRIRHLPADLHGTGVATVMAGDGVVSDDAIGGAIWDHAPQELGGATAQEAGERRWGGTGN